MMGYVGTGWGWMMGVGMFLFWGAIIFLVIWSVTRLTKQSTSTHARTILEERFARGEIDEEEFHKRSVLLSGS